MPIFYVDRKPQRNGDHVVHDMDCRQMPDSYNRFFLGTFFSCHTAVAEAKQYFSQINGCPYCCRECHAGDPDEAKSYRRDNKDRTRTFSGAGNG